MNQPAGAEMLPRDCHRKDHMKLKPRYALTVRPDKDGEYPDDIARRLIAAGLADPITEKPKRKEKRR